MKGVIEKVLALIWVLVPVLIIVVVHSSNIAELAEGRIQLRAKIGAIEIASSISALQSGPDGMGYMYDLPIEQPPGCVKIYQSYVVTNFYNRKGEAELIEQEAFSAAIVDKNGHVPNGKAIELSCGAVGKLVLKKVDGKVKILTGEIE